MLACPPDRLRVVIVGGGFSGTIMAAQLARRGIRCALIEGGGKLARGTAFSTREPAHLLNVRAAMMSAWPDDPDHFARAIAAEGGSGEDFAKRGRFGRYLGEIFEEAAASGRVRTVAGQATRARRSDHGWEILLDGGDVIRAETLVLAHGNQPSEPMRAGEGISPERLVNNPWNSEAGPAVAWLAAEGGDVLILGTGLTMIDMVLSLDAAGHQGRILALSRRGQIPRSHAQHEPAPVEEADVPSGNVLELWRWLRRRGGEVGWRAALDSLRPYSQVLWQALSAGEQERFLRHARPWWDVHRHRIAPEVARRIKELVGEGRLEVVAGRVMAMRETGEGVEVKVARRGQPLTPLASGESPSPSRGEGLQGFAVAFNCTGPLGRMERTRDPLLRQMIDEGLVEIDRLGIGLEVDEQSRAGASVWALGPLTKGRFWEMIAVPDIRGQAATVAADIEAELAR